MEEKERYEVISPSLNGYAYIHDFKTDNVLNTYDSCDLLNQQSKRIKELENENKQLKQQLHDLPKKIVEEIRDITGDYWEECENNSNLITITNEDFDEILDTILKKYGDNNESIISV